LGRLEDVAYNAKKILSLVCESAVKSGRSPDSVQLLAATKTVSPDLINAAIDAGIKLVGENRVQELTAKFDEINKASAEVHFIGHLQTNKVNKVVGRASMIHSVDSLKLASEISKYSVASGVCTKILAEVNIGGECSKSGVSPKALPELLEGMSALEGIKVSGLMTIPPICENIDETERYFANMQQLFIDIKAKNMDNVDMIYLSMGMSADFQSAIKYGSNIVRVGSAIFGARIY